MIYNTYNSIIGQCLVQKGFKMTDHPLLLKAQCKKVSHSVEWEHFQGM